MRKESDLKSKGEKTDEGERGKWQKECRKWKYKTLNTRATGFCRM